MSEIEKYIGEALMKEEPKKKLSLKIKDDTIGTSQLKDKAVTKDKVDDEAIGWDNLDHNVQNIIETSGSGGTGLATDWGDSEKLGITQKKLTEEHEEVDARIGALENDLDENYYTKDDVYNKSETYTKDEVNNIASAYTSQKYATVEASASTTASDIATLIAIQAASMKEATDTIYRVANFDGTEYDTTKYAEYTYNGTSYILMDVKSPGIDNKPLPQSEKLVESGGIYNFVSERGRNFIHEASVGDGENDDLTKYDIYTFKPNTVYRIRPSYDVFPNQTTNQWGIALVAYFNSEAISSNTYGGINFIGKKAGDKYYITPSNFDYIRLGLRGVPFYSIEITEVSESSNHIVIDHETDVNYNILHPAKAGDTFDINVKTAFSDSLSSNNAILVGYYKNDGTYTQLDSLNDLKCVNNIHRVSIPSSASDAVALYITPYLSGDFVSDIEIKKVYTEINDSYFEENEMPVYSRLDKNEVLWNTPSNSFWGPFHGASLTKNGDYVSVSCPKIGEEDENWPGIRINKTFEEGRVITVNFRYKSEEPVKLYFSGIDSYDMQPSEDWCFAEVTTEVKSTFGRLQLSVDRSAISEDATFHVKDFQVCYENDGTVQQRIRRLDTLTETYSPKRQLSVPFEINIHSAIRVNGTYNDDVSYMEIWRYIVEPNGLYLVSGHRSEGQNSPLVNWFDADGNFISNELQNKSESEEKTWEMVEIKAPANARYLYLNVISAYTFLHNAYGFVSDLNNPLKGKTIAVIGDSISTNGKTGIDCNVPEIVIDAEDVGVSLSAYITATDVSSGLSINGTTYTSSDIGTKVTFTPALGDVGKRVGVPANYNDNFTKTWWEWIKDYYECNIIPVCWSGSSITSHEGSKDDYKASYAWHESQIKKCGVRTPGTMTRTAPDVIIIFRGTNDLSHTSGSRNPFTADVVLTDDYFNGTVNYPDDDTVTGGFGFKEGYYKTIGALRAAYPFARIVLCTLSPFKRINYSKFPTNNGTNSLPEYNLAIREVAEYCGCDVIDFDKCGITFENMYPFYISDSATNSTHPNDNGHVKMAERAIIDMLK